MADERRRQFVWDLPIRLFHWLIVALIGFAWWSAEYRYMDWHYRAGIAVCGLLVFRILWGIFGTNTARFTQFLKGPRAMWDYVRPGEGGPKAAPLGHNPLGAISVIALLFLLCLQVVSGLFATDEDMIGSGPLSDWLDSDWSDTITAVHHWSFTLLQIMVVLHLAAIVFYLVVKRRNLTWAMITGSRPAEGEESAKRAPIWRLVVAILVAAALAWWVGNGFKV